MRLCVLQAGAGLVGSCLGSGPGAAQRFQMALEDSIARHFPGNHAINCMCHSSENFYRYGHAAEAALYLPFGVFGRACKPATGGAAVKGLDLLLGVSPAPARPATSINMYLLSG